MKQVTIDVTTAKAFFTDLRRALEPAALDCLINTEGMSDRDIRNSAEIVRETVLLAEEKRLAAGRKVKG